MKIRMLVIGTLAFSWLTYSVPQAPESFQTVNVGVIAEHKKGSEPLKVEVTERKQPVITGEIRPISDLPRRILILVDQSGSARHLAGYYRNAIAKIAETLPDYSRDTVAIAAFNDKIGMIVPFTNNKQLLLKSLDQLGGKGRTRLYDAVFLALGSAIVEMKKSAGFADLIVISDGGENGSDHSVEDVVERISASGVRVSAFDEKVLGHCHWELATGMMKSLVILSELAVEFSRSQLTTMNLFKSTASSQT